MPEGCVELRRPSKDRSDNYTVGQVMRCAKIPGGGGDGHYWTVVTVLPKFKDYGGDEEWMISAYARPATEAEAAPLLAAKQAKENRAAWINELQELARQGVVVTDTATKPEGVEIVLVPGVHGSGRYVAVKNDAGVSVYTAGHYDDYRSVLATTTDPRAVELFALLSAV